MSETAEHGDTVVVTVTPSEGYHVATFTVDGVEVEIVDNKYTFTITDNTRIVVEFERITYTVSVNSPENGSVIVSENTKYGDEVVVTVTPAEGYQVATFTVDGEPAELVDGKYTFRIESNVNVAVEFEKQTYSITTKVSNATIEVVSSAKYLEEVTFTVDPVEGYEITSVKVNGEVVTDYKFTITGATEIIVETAKIVYTITKNSPENGTISVSETAEHGDTVVVTVAPNTGYKVATFTVDGVEKQLENNAYSFVIEKNTAVSVEFEKIEYTVTANNPANGTISVSENTKYGDTVVVTVTPAEGYQVATFTVDGADKKADLAEGKYTFVIDKNVNVAVEFEKQTYAITTQVSNATIKVVSKAQYQSEVTFEVTADYGYKIVSVKVNGQVVDEYKFVITGVTEIIVETAKIVYTITKNSPENGTISVSETAEHGDTVVVTVAPAEGYQVATFTVGEDNKKPELVASEGKYTYNFTITDNTRIVVEFERITYTVSTNTPENGSIRVSENTKYGDSVVVTVTPAEGYKVAVFTVDGVEVELVDGKYTFTITADTTIAVEFEQSGYTVTINGGASLTNGTVDVVYGEKGAIITLTGNENYSPLTFDVDGIDNWSSLVDAGDGKYTYTIEELQTNIAIECSFAYTIYQNGATAGAEVSYPVSISARTFVLIKTDNGY